MTNPPPVTEGVSETGFERVDGKLHWHEDEQSTRTPSVTFTQSANETTEDGRLKFADTGDWALIKRPPQANVQFVFYEDPGQPTVTRMNRPATNGAADDETAGGSGPGFGLVGTLVALATLLLVGHRIE